MFESTHKLEFLVSVKDALGFSGFKVGTCHGLWRSTTDSYEILAVINETPNNGHFTDVLEWFFNSCQRDNRVLHILECWNKRLKTHMIEKHGFVDIGNDTIEKKFE